MKTMLQRFLHIGLIAGVAWVAAGCTQDQTAQNRGNYTKTRHMVTGSNVPVPDRADAANESTSDLDREQLQDFQNSASAHGMSAGGGSR